MNKPARKEFYMGLDLGQANDPSALAILKRIPRVEQKPLYHLGHVERYPLGTEYPKIVSHVGAALRSDLLADNCQFLADATGVGRPVVDMFRAARLPVTAITITGGDVWSRDDKGGFRVPKKELASVLQVVLQSGRLLFAEELPLLSVLKHELLNFKVKINLATGHESFEAWREGDHDDLVLAVALAIWYAERLCSSNYRAAFGFAERQVETAMDSMAGGQPVGYRNLYAERNGGWR